MYKEILVCLLVIGCGVAVYAQSSARKPANITATYEVLINVPIDTVWKALAVDYGGIGKWASGVNHVIETSGAGVSAQRYCEISASGFNDTRERMLVFEPERYYFEYELYEGLPKFIDYSINQDQLTAKGNQTLWTSTNIMRVGGLMGGTMKGFMTKKLKDVLASKGQELKHYLETGRQHPNKLAAMAKKDKKILFALEQKIQASPEAVWKVIADDFAKVADSHPVSPKSVFTGGSTEVKVGSQRIMYMSKNEKKYFVDEIVQLDATKKEMAIEVAEAKGYPIAFARVDFWVNSLESDATNLMLIFSYQTRPRFLQKLARKNLKKQLQAYLYAIDHHVTTGEVITKKKWKKIRKTYPKS